MIFRKDPLTGKWRWMTLIGRNPEPGEYTSGLYFDRPGETTTIDGWRYLLLPEQQ